MSAKKKSIPELKDQFTKKLKSIIDLHEKGTGGVRISLALAQRLDWILKSIFALLPDDQQLPLAIVALGGYGRNELCFSSDADILFLVTDDTTKATGAHATKVLLHTILDIGIDVGHSFRTIQECLDIAISAIEPSMSLMEARFVCGNATVFTRFQKQMRASIQSRNPVDFLRTLFDINEARHTKYGKSAKLLEPNIKNSAGGLRDLHTSLWLMYGTGYCDLPDQLSRKTAISSLLSSPAILYIFSKAFSSQVLAAYDFLLRVRNEMHFQSKSIHDILEFGFQRHVASGLGYRPTTKRTSVEHFMQDYYSATKIIAKFSSRILLWAKDEWKIEKNPATIRLLNKDFFTRSKKLYIHSNLARITNGLILNAYIACCQNKLTFSFEFEDAIYRAAPKLRPLRKKEESLLFRTLLNQDQGVANSFRSMTELGLLERWIPEWKPMVSFFQHNQYHFYTADEHTLLVIANAESLYESTSSFGTAYRALPRKDILYLACFLHDIAKPVHIGKHEITGARIANQLLYRLHYTDEIQDVMFLVRNHLSMEQVAFRRNLNDPQTIAQYSRLFKKPELLPYLFVLTYADLSSVNRNVLTQWKEILLNELFRHTSSMLEQHLTPDHLQNLPKQQFDIQAKQIVKELSSIFTEDEIRTHLKRVGESAYVSLFPSEEIGKHITALRNLNSVATVFKNSEEFTEVTILATDAPYALSKFCGVLAANDANIFDAQIFTLNNGTIIDKFRVVDFLTKSSLASTAWQKISNELRDVITGTMEITTLLEHHRLKWKRRTQLPNPNIRRDVVFEEHPSFTIIDVFAADTLGFLYKITTTISELGLNISFAKIATRVDGIVDSFYVVDENGKKIENPTRLENIRESLLKTITELSDSELVIS